MAVNSTDMASFTKYLDLKIGFGMLPAYEKTFGMPLAGGTMRQYYFWTEPY